VNGARAALIDTETTAGRRPHLQPRDEDLVVGVGSKGRRPVLVEQLHGSGCGLACKGHVAMEVSELTTKGQSREPKARDSVDETKVVSPERHRHQARHQEPNEGPGDCLRRRIDRVDEGHGFGPPKKQQQQLSAGKT